MPIGEQSNLTSENFEVYRLYHWLTFLDLDKGLKEFGEEKGYFERVTDDSIDGVNIIDCEKHINYYKGLPFYRRLFISFFSPINELIDLHIFYKAKMLLQKLAIKADFDAQRWQEALIELKELDRQAQSNLPFLSLKYLIDKISQWPVPAKNKDYIFNNVKYAFSNPNNWRIGTVKTLNIEERQKLRDLDDLAEYFLSDIDKKCESEDFETITDEKIEYRKWQIADFKNSVATYYNDVSWDVSVKDKCIETVKVISDYLSLALDKVMNLLPLATYSKCLKEFREDQTPSNSEKFNDAAMKLRDRKSLPPHSSKVVHNFKIHQLDATFDLQKQKLDDIEESVRIEESYEQYRRAHI
jgi:hypothetical protein